MQEPVVLVGNSTGSLVCMLANAKMKDGAVRGTVLLNCAGGMNNKQNGEHWCRFPLGAANCQVHTCTRVYLHSSVEVIVGAAQ